MEHNKQNEFVTSQLYEKLLIEIDRKMNSWTKEEDEKLMGMINSHQDDWEKCSRSFHQKDSFQCFRRYILIRKKNTKGSWTKIEDTFLRKYVDLLGNDKWNQIGSLVPGRISKQCRERWNNQLNPKIKTCRFSQEERMLLISLQKQFGNKWTKISTYFQGRTGNQLKNFWHSNISSENRLKRSLKQNEKMTQEKKKIQKRQEPHPAKIKRRRKNNRKKIIVVRRKNNQKIRKSVDLGQFQNKNKDAYLSFSKNQPEPVTESKPKIENEEESYENTETCHPILDFNLLKTIGTINDFNVISPKQKTIQRKREYDQTAFKHENTTTDQKYTTTIQKNTNENVDLNNTYNINEKDFFSQTLLKSSETTTIPTSPKKKKYEFFQINEIALEDDSYDNDFTPLKKEPFSTNINNNSNFNSFESFDSQDFSDIQHTLYNFYDSDFIDISFNSQTETYSGNFFLDNFQL